MEYNREVNILMKQNYGEGFPQVDFMKCVTGRRMEIQAGVGI